MLTDFVHPNLMCDGSQGTTLAHLNVSNNTLGDEGGVLIAQALLYNSGLERCSTPFPVAAIHSSLTSTAVQPRTWPDTMMQSSPAGCSILALAR